MGLVRCDVQNFISCPLFVQLVMEEKMSSSLIKPEKINRYVDVIWDVKHMCFMWCLIVGGVIPSSGYSMKLQLIIQYLPSLNHS